MKKQITSIILISGCLLFSKIVSAQQYDDLRTMNAMPSSEVWSFMKYGRHSPNLYTGTVSASIPIYTYKDPDFEIPISLNYASNGYLPNTQASSVGLSWFLSAGGYITREVNGIRDDLNTSNGIGTKGFYACYDNSYPPLFNDEDIFGLLGTNFQSDYLIPTYNYFNSYKYAETTPDIHTFNFLGHSGRFSMGFDGRVYVYNANHPHGEYYVILGAYEATDYSSTHLQADSQINIITGDGYQYVFNRKGEAGRYDNYLKGLPSKYSYNATPKNYWMLSKITAPNGRTAIFEYGDIEYSDKSQYISKYEWSENGGWISTTREYVAQLKSITIGDFSIEFQYGNRTPEKVHHISGFYNSHTPETLSSIKKLDQIVISHGSNVLKTCTFSYAYSPANDNPVLFLKKVDISGEGCYEMDYYKMNTSFPAHATSHIDHWGYFNNPINGNNRYDMESILPTAVVDANNVETVTSTNRNPNFEGSIRGMLKTLVYPTKGYTKFYYEPHTYRKMVTRDLTDNHKNLPYLKTLSEDQIAGGVRIRKITDYKTAADSSYKVYYYNHFMSRNDDESTGILLHFPRYKQGEMIRPANYITYSMDKTHIEYSSVYESFSDGSYKHYSYSNYTTMPDIIYDYRRVRLPSGSVTSAPDEVNLKAETFSRSAQRGKLTSEFSYNADGILVKRLSNYYNTQKELKYHPCVKAAGYYYIHKIFVDDYDLVSTVEDLLIDGRATGYAVLKEYEYTPKGQLAKTSYSKNFGEIDRIDSVEYVYIDPDDYRISRIFTTGLPEKKFTMERINGTNRFRIVDMEKYVYNINGLNRHYMQLARVDKAVSQHPRGFDGEPTYSHFPTFYEYDKMRRIACEHTDGYATFYIWGYNGCYPVAEIKGDYHTLSTAIKNISGLNYTVAEPMAGGLTASQEAALRNIPGASVITQKYIPFVGVSETVDASGRKTTYEYNQTGKLSRIYDGDGKVLEEYSYSTDDN